MDFIDIKTLIEKKMILFTKCDKTTDYRIKAKTK